MHDRALEHQFVSTMARESAETVHEYRLTSQTFSDSNAGAIYEAICAVAEHSKHVTPALVRRMLRERNLLRSAGGEQTVATILDAPVSITFGAMKRTLAELHRLRSIHGASMAVAALAAGGQLGAAESAARNLLDAIAAQSDDDQGEYSTREVAEMAVRHYLTNQDQGKRLQVPILGEVLGRPAPGSLTVVGGQTGGGKSSLTLLLAEAYERIGDTPGIISLEDPVHIWGERVLARSTSVSLAETERSGITTEQRDRIFAGLDSIQRNTTRWAILDQYDHLEVCGKMRRLVGQGCKVIFVDYLQLMSHRVMLQAPRAQMMAAIAKDLKSEAKRLGVPLYLCSQIRRPENRPGKWEPTMHDLKESGDIENMAEAILLLWKTSDSDDAMTLGKLAKLKSGSRRPRFQIIRNHAGSIVDLHLHTEEPPPKRRKTVRDMAPEEFEA